MKLIKKVQKGILSLVFTMLLAASLSLGIGAGEVQAASPSPGVSEVSSWSDLKTSISNSNNGGVIKLTGDVTAGAGDVDITVDGKNVILDLNGFTINRNLTQASNIGRVFCLSNNATLTIRDSSAGQTGKITGAWNAEDNGGCIEVQSGCTLNLEGGSIEGNKNAASTPRAGGVYNAGTFNMTGGKITGNTADYGAGVLVIGNAATFTMTGGEITGNTCSGGSEDKGAGVYAYNGASVTLGGEAKITGNTTSTGAAGNLYIDSSYAINLSSTALTGNAKIGVSTKATDTVAITTEGKDQAAFFEADDSAHFEISTSQVDNSIYLAKKGGAAFTNSTVPENNVYSAALSGTMDQLMDQLLTPEEKAEIAAGTLNIEVMLTASDTVSEDEKRQIEAAKGNAQIGKYINLTLMIKKSGKDEWLPVQNTAGGPVTITLQVPGELINSNGAVTRTYQIIRLHSGADGMVATVLPCTYDPATGTVSFQTDRFSAYAIAYTDQQNGDSGSGGSGDGGSAAPAAEAPKLDAVPKTGDSNEAAVLLAFALLSGIGAVILWKGSYRKENSH